MERVCRERNLLDDADKDTIEEHILTAPPEEKKSEESWC